MSYENLSRERRETVALITLDRPESLNAMRYELSCALDQDLPKIENDDLACLL